ncbi:MAG: hypothetical protein JSV89_15730 [Spirochaetaceae bacterium]|nr:MAG: hypothetical protein JSV89_15730 [Spirochaetaceae bacterium]
MNDSALIKATGRSKAQWFQIIRQAGKAEASHKEIADFLHGSHEVSFWWAQEITVEYEKQIGRRVLGQTQDGLFQIGISKTIDAPADEVWACLQSSRGVSLITSVPNTGEPTHKSGHLGSRSDSTAAATGLDSLETLDGQSASGIRVSTTTFQNGSHVRMRWQLPVWQTHSILQIRVTPKSETKTTLTFHQEKLPSQDERRKMRDHWKRIAGLLGDIAATSRPD